MQAHNVIGKNVKLTKEIQNIPVAYYHVDSGSADMLYLVALFPGPGERQYFSLYTRAISLGDYLEIVVT